MKKILQDLIKKQEEQIKNYLKIKPEKIKNLENLIFENKLKRKYINNKALIDKRYEHQLGQMQQLVRDQEQQLLNIQEDKLLKQTQDYILFLKKELKELKK